MAGNPYKSKEFVSRIHVWLQDVDPLELRRLVQEKGLITFHQLERLRKIKDTAQHNSNLIAMLCAGETESYLVLCSVIREMGFTNRYQEMLRIVPNAQQAAAADLLPDEEQRSSAGQPRAPGMECATSAVDITDSPLTAAAGSTPKAGSTLQAAATVTAAAEAVAAAAA
eukprot:scpid99598/ scgid9203/ 